MTQSRADSTIYTTKQGDTLRLIAEAFYQQRNYWPFIYNANQQTIGINPNFFLVVGTQLVIPPLPADIPGWSYIVQPGDTLEGIARKFYLDIALPFSGGDGKRWPEIYAANRQTIGDDPNLIQPGMRLTIPGPFMLYTVQSGETLSSIAMKFYGNTDTLSVLHDVNRVVIGNDPTLLVAGMVIVIPEPPPPGHGGSGFRGYTVQSGDTLSIIAFKFYGDSSQWGKICNANRDIIANCNVIWAGMILTIPG